MASFPMCLAIILRRAAILSYRMCAIGSRSFAQLVHSKVRSTFRLLELGPMAKANAARRLLRAEMLTCEASTPYMAAGRILHKTNLSLTALVRGIHRSLFAMAVAFLNLAVMVAPLLLLARFIWDPRPLNE